MNLFIFFIVIFLAFDQANAAFPVTPRAACVPKDECLTKLKSSGYTITIQGDSACHYNQVHCVA